MVPICRKAWQQLYNVVDRFYRRIGNDPSDRCISVSCVQLRLEIDQHLALDVGGMPALDLRQRETHRVMIAVMDWHKLETFSFGDSSELADELLALVLEGKKRATCWAVSEGLKGAALAKCMVALDGAHRPRAVLQTVELAQHRFDEVGEAFAFDEGEGDRSLAYWRKAHRRYFTRLSLYRPDMMLWCERFKLVSAIALE